MNQRANPVNINRLMTAGCWVLLSAAPLGAVDFNADVQPILADACFRCHGPDQGHREAELRLDQPPSANARRQLLAIDGELLRRITSKDPELKMPPESAARQLTTAEIESLTQWVQSGAKWGEHWAFAPPQRSELPEASESTWSRQPIDRFVGDTLRKKEWRPSARADRETLIRRATLDLTGLPPTLEELDAFLADTADDQAAYQRVVDRLFTSPRYGERMASFWLDAARYADTSGYQNDGPREMWRYRDWVIDAFNNNMPFDQFTMLQIAGDLLVASSDEQQPTDYDSAWRGKLIQDPQRLAGLIPSAFHRNHRGNAEGGIIADEYRAEYVVDRVDTTATVWLGLTLGCCRCHDHKYDPFQQREFYELFAFFNNVPEFGRAIKEGNSPPFIKAPTQQQLAQWKSLQREAEDARRQVQAMLGSQAWRRAYATYLADAQSHDDSNAIVSDGLVSRLTWNQEPLDRGSLRDVWPDDANRGRWWSLRSQSEQPAAAKSQVGESPERNGRSWEGRGDAWLEALAPHRDETDFGYLEAFSISAWVSPAATTGSIVSRMNLGPEQDGYSLHLQDGKVQLNLVKRWLDDSLRVETANQLPLNQWTHVTATYDGSRHWQGVQIYFNGQPQTIEVRQDFLNQTFAAVGQPLRIGHGAVPFQGKLDDVRIYRRILTPQEARIIAEPKSLSRLAQTAPDAEKLVAHFHNRAAPPWVQRLVRRADGAAKRLADWESTLPTLMVMQELAAPRETHVLLRGQHDQPGERVEPDVPDRLHPLPPSAPRNRIGLARWLVDRDNPLTARVLVNRLWQLHFGAGLVKTAEDFGVQGARPSHPELLDWLAVELMESGWNVQAIQRRILLSETYCQSSIASATAKERDPENRWLSRGPRFRLPAEMVRDQALAASGLIKHRLGGPSVRPYQPPGLWQEIATDTHYEQSHGDNLYRRSLYTYWKRTVAPPTMMTLDAVSRESCVVQRTRTNTPLQALALMNETSFVEAARMLAARAMRHAEPEDSPKSQILMMFRLVASRRPTAHESEVLNHAFQRHRQRFQSNVPLAEQLLATGEAPRDKELETVHWAAMTMVASTILNLDEAITKE